MTQAFNLSQLANNVNTSGQLNAAAGLYNQVPVANGGTGQSSFTGNAAIITNAAGTALSAVAAGAVGNVLTSDGTTWVSGASGGGTPVYQVYTTPGTWTKPATLKGIKVTVVGGGGTGGNAGPSVPGGTFQNVGAGGSAGGAAIRVYPAASIPGPQPYTVGAATQTSSFGVTSVPAPFTVISATGGASASQTVGVGSNGMNNFKGGGAAASFSITGAGVSGLGGNSIFGGGGSNGFCVLGSAISVTGGAGGGYGSGGGGGARSAGPNSNAGTSPGGAGAPGVVIVEEYY